MIAKGYLIAQGEHLYPEVSHRVRESAGRVTRALQSGDIDDAVDALVDWIDARGLAFVLALVHASDRN